MSSDLLNTTQYEEANIVELKRVIIFTSVDEKTILFRQFELNAGKTVNQTDVKNLTLSMNETGPRFDLQFRRDKIADGDLYKAACKKPRVMKAETKRLKKNLYTDEFGQQKGKVFIQ